MKGQNDHKNFSLTDNLGNLVKFHLISGQYYDLAEIKPLIKDIDFQALLADKVFDADCLLKELMIKAQRPVIPPKPIVLFSVYLLTVYKWRHLIENYFYKLKEPKCIAMRSDKTDSSFAAMIYLYASIINSC